MLLISISNYMITDKYSQSVTGCLADFCHVQLRALELTMKSHVTLKGI